MKNLIATSIVAATTCTACVLNWNPDQLQDSTTQDTPEDDIVIDDVSFDNNDFDVDTIDLPVDSNNEESLIDNLEDEMAEDTEIEVLDTTIDDGIEDLLDTLDTLEDTYIDTIDIYDLTEDSIAEDLFDAPDDSSIDMDVIDLDITEDIIFEDAWDTISEDTYIEDTLFEDILDTISEDATEEDIIDIPVDDGLTPTCTGGYLSGVVYVSASSDHTCALMNYGGVKCWGFNDDGQLGDGTWSGKTTPVDVIGLASGVDQIRGGHKHTCALMQTGGVKCWGYGIYGEIGDGTFVSKNVPTDVIGLSSGIASIGIGSYLACAVTDTDLLKCWGHNNLCQLGDGSTSNRNTPTDITSISLPVAIAAPGGDQSCALLEAGTVKCWGANNSGQLGNGTTSPSCSPVDAIGLTNIEFISGKQYHTCAINNLGALKCWGWNQYGQIGDNTTVHQLTPTSVVGMSSGVNSVSTGWANTCALLDSGQVWCWGRNADGELGNGTTIESHVPVQVLGLSSTPVQLTNGTRSSCVLLDNTQVECWGYNGDGQLGNGGTVSSSTPVRVLCE